MRKLLQALLIPFWVFGITNTLNAQAQLRADGATARIVCTGSPYIILNNMGYANNASNALFTAANSKVRFIGNTTVSVTSTAGYDTEFYNLEINKTGGSEIDVASNNVDLITRNNLEMVSGNVDMNNNLSSTIVLGVSTAINGTLIRTSGHIYNGYFKRWYNTTGTSDAPAWDIPMA
ncbi:MAG: hypothetical protein LC101_08585 [Flavobacteriales bacterium]|nr:hypothetical protein [Flavobacteriales bacterium]